MSKGQPIVLVFAGPNGSGKTTVTRRLPIVGTYINADDLKKKYRLTDLEAAKQGESIRKALLAKGADFSFETVLSTERNLLLLEKAKERGYQIQCIYVLTCDENINIARVRARHAAGGHDVPEDKIRIRYHRALAQIPRLAKICDKLLIYDNSSVPTLMVHKDYFKINVYPNNFWSEQEIQKLLGSKLN